MYLQLAGDLIGFVGTHAESVSLVRRSDENELDVPQAGAGHEQHDPRR
jgi:hypothetical protein